MTSTQTQTSALDNQSPEDPIFRKVIDLFRDNYRTFQATKRTGSFGVEFTIEEGEITEVTHGSTVELQDAASPDPVTITLAEVLAAVTDTRAKKTMLRVAFDLGCNPETRDTWTC